MPYTEELYHYGVLGMKWGIRRYQNPDGSLTDAGRKRYLTDEGKLNERGKKTFTKAIKDSETATDPNTVNKLSKNPLVKALSKDVQLKEAIMRDADEKVEKDMMKFLKNVPLRFECARKAAESEADEVIDGDPGWKHHGFHDRNGFIESTENFYTDIGGVALYRGYYAHNVNKNSLNLIKKRGSASRAYMDSLDKFGTEIATQLADDLIRKPTADELKDMHITMDMYMNNNIGFISTGIGYAYEKMSEKEHGSKP